MICEGMILSGEKGIGIVGHADGDATTGALEEMSLKQQLSRERDHWASVLDLPTVALMNRATDALRAPEILGQVLQEGAQAPNFRLRNAQGGSIELNASGTARAGGRCRFRRPT